MPDPRLETLAKLAKSAEIVPTRLTFVDIAGLVKGASKGEGLGNQFLGNIREVDAIAHVVRCFDDGDVTHVANKIDPIADNAAMLAQGKDASFQNKVHLAMLAKGFGANNEDEEK